jgi:hypothetical protein
VPTIEVAKADVLLSTLPSPKSPILTFPEKITYQMLKADFIADFPQKPARSMKQFCGLISLWIIFLEWI